MEIERFVKISQLLEAYKNCLTNSQYEVMSSFLELGYEQSEIAENNSKSRQSISKMLKTTIQKLESLESKIGFVKYQNSVQKDLNQLEKFIKNTKLVDATKLINSLKNS